MICEKRFVCTTKPVLPSVDLLLPVCCRITQNRLWHIESKTGFVVQTNLVWEAFKKKNRGFSEFGTKGGRVSDLNHYFEQQ